MIFESQNSQSAFYSNLGVPRATECHVCDTLLVQRYHNDQRCNINGVIAITIADACRDPLLLP